METSRLALPFSGGYRLHPLAIVMLFRVPLGSAQALLKCDSERNTFVPLASIHFDDEHFQTLGSNSTRVLRDQVFVLQRH